MSWGPGVKVASTLSQKMPLMPDLIAVVGRAHVLRAQLLEDLAAHATGDGGENEATGTHRSVIPSLDPTVRRPDRHESLPLGRGEESEPRVAS